MSQTIITFQSPKKQYDAQSDLYGKHVGEVIKFTCRWQFSTTINVWAREKFVYGWKLSENGWRMIMMTIQQSIEYWCQGIGFSAFWNKREIEIYKGIWM